MGVELLTKLSHSTNPKLLAERCKQIEKYIEQLGQYVKNECFIIKLQNERVVYNNFITVLELKRSFYRN